MLISNVLRLAVLSYHPFSFCTYEMHTSFLRYIIINDSFLRNVMSLIIKNKMHIFFGN